MIFKVGFMTLLDAVRRKEGESIDDTSICTLDA